MIKHLVVLALPDEFAHMEKEGIIVPSDSGELGSISIFRCVDSAENVRVIVTGVGMERSAKITEQAINIFKPSTITSMGFCGITKPDIRPGNLAIIHEVRSMKGTPREWNKKMLTEPIYSDHNLLKIAQHTAEEAGLHYDISRLLTLPVLAKTVQLKAWIGDHLQIPNVDMESYSAGETAAKHGIPFVIVRAPLDSVNLALPDIVAEMGDVPGSERIKSITKHLLRHPTDLGKFASLGICVSKAQNALACFIRIYQRELSQFTMLEAKESVA